MIPSPLADIHASLGARFTELSDHRLVAAYGDPAREHQQVRTKGGLIDRCYRGKLRVVGPDRVALLQGMSTNDVEKQADDSAIPNAICTGHGKAQSLFTTIRRANDFLLDMDPTVTAFTAAFLEKYTIIRDAKTEDVSAEFAHFGLYGPNASTVAAAGLELDPSALPSAPGRVLEHGDMLVIATDEYGVAGFDLLLPVDSATTTWRALAAAGAEHGVMPFGFEALESLRIETGRARFGVEVDDGVILLEAGFADTVNFEKGCYIGQETLSRITFRGHLNKGLRGLVLDAIPKPGAQVHANTGDDADAEAKPVGEVKSAVHSPTLGKALALAYIKRSHWQPGTKVTVDGAPAQVVALPLGND